MLDELWAMINLSASGARLDRKSVIMHAREQPQRYWLQWLMRAYEV